MTGRSARLAVPGLAACALALNACGTLHATADADAHADALQAQALPAPVPAGIQARLAASVRVARHTYTRETRGSKLSRETDRLAADTTLLGALARGDVTGARAQAQSQLMSPSNHLAHVTRISVTRAGRVLVNATLNSDGSFVVAPARRELQLHNRPLGTLLVSIQDVTGFVKLVHRLTGSEVLARGASGQVRASLASAAGVRLPSSGSASIAGRTYVVRSFTESAWGGEPLTVWILEPR
ncbi:MAG TPA: hypothetical protein VGX51_04870 [Solirubrobacteraceae bacterium]|nr:hypothetical protein [Solirubrobacteraceae bacterium]